MPRNTAVSPRPVDGSQLRYTANSMIIIRPTQKDGSEKPRIELAMIPREIRCSGNNPAYRPSGIPRKIAISRDTSASSIVAGM